MLSSKLFSFHHQCLMSHNHTRNPEQSDHTVGKLQDQISQLKSETVESGQYRPHPKPSYPEPKLRLKVLDLAHPGCSIFFANSNPCTALAQAVETVLSTLYPLPNTDDLIPPTKSVVLILRSMGGVAYTTGSDSDDDDKRIYFSLDYIKGVAEKLTQPGQSGAEIHGVIVHEMVHCWQWNGKGTAPGGLIEGIADYVRLKAGLIPSHWHRGGPQWDAGCTYFVITSLSSRFEMLYHGHNGEWNAKKLLDQTTAYFLDWIENNKGQGSVRKINNALKNQEYKEKDFWKNIFDCSVDDLWKEYSKTLPEECRSDDKDKAKESTDA